MANDNNNIQITDESQIVLYQPNESISLQVKIDASHDTVWLTQQQIADFRYKTTSNNKAFEKYLQQWGT